METGGGVVMNLKHYKHFAKYHRAIYNNEMIFRYSKEPIRAYNPAYNVIPITKYSPLMEIFNPLVLRLQAGGIIEQLAKFYYLDFHEVDRKQELQPITLEHMYIGTFGYIAGLFIALVAFCCEKYAGRESA